MEWTYFLLLENSGVEALKRFVSEEANASVRHYSNKCGKQAFIERTKSLFFVNARKNAQQAFIPVGTYKNGQITKS